MTIPVISTDNPLINAHFPEASPIFSEKLQVFLGGEIPEVWNLIIRPPYLRREIGDGTSLGDHGRTQAMAAMGLISGYQQVGM